MFFLGLISFVVVLAVSITWIIPIIISLILSKKLNASVKIGRFGIIYLKLYDVEYIQNGIKVNIKEIGLNSSFFNAEVKKLVTLVTQDVSISYTVQRKIDYAATQPNALGEEKKKVDFRNSKIPASLPTFAQFMALHVYNISALIVFKDTFYNSRNQKEDIQNVCLYADAKELHLDGSIVQNSQSLLVNVNLLEASARALDANSVSSTDGAKIKDGESLAEIRFAITTEATLIAQGPLSFEKLSIGIWKTSAIITEGLYRMIQKTSSDHKTHFRTLPVTSNTDSKQKDVDYEETFTRIAPIIPKNFVMRIDNTSLRGVRKFGHNDFAATLSNFLCSYRFYGATGNSLIPHMLASFVIDDLVVRNSREQLILLKKIKLDAKVDNYIVDLYLFLNTLNVAYDHETIYTWLSTHFMQKRNIATSQFAVTPPKTPEKSLNTTRKFLQPYILNGCAELLNVTGLIRFSDDNNDYISSVGVNLVKFILNQTADSTNAISHAKSGFKNSQPSPDVLFGDRVFQTELLVESLCWSFKDCAQDSHISKKIHFWGTPLYLNMALIHYEVSLDAEEGRGKLVKVHSIVDGLQLEWSNTLAEYTVLALKAFKQYDRRVSKNVTSGLKVSDCDKKDVRVNLQVNLHQVNCFFNSTESENEYLALRLDTIKFDYEVLKSSEVVSSPSHVSTIQLEEIKLSLAKISHAYYTCQKCEDIKDYKLYAQIIRVQIQQQQQQLYNQRDIHLHLLNNIQMQWCPNSHLKLLYLIRDIREFIELFNQEKVRSKTSTKTTNLALDILGNVNIDIKVSQNHSIRLSFDEMTMNYLSAKSHDILNKDTPKITLSNSQFSIFIDDALVFALTGIFLQPVTDANVLELVRAERLDTETFNTDWNDPQILEIASLKAIFPYEHSFADAINNDFVSLVKWLKLVHKPLDKDDKVKPMQKSILPRDLLINIKEFVFEMSDDPFEIKLRDNFELLVDEYHESLKRRKKLADKVDQLVMKHLHLPAGKVEELYANLQEKNAQIYIQRSKQLSKEEGQRRRLFAWTCTNVELMILADDSIYGTENIVRVMREIDCDTPWPEEPLEFSTLWCRMVSLRCEEWKFQLRDFPQPFLLIQQWYISGMLVGAEQLAPKRATRDVYIDLGPPFSSPLISRSLLPLKFYHDFNSEISSFSYAFGPCWEPVIAQCNLSFEKIFQPSRDPSPPLPFWDKMRLLLHGRLTMEVQQLTVLLHASLDPYNTTEEMELTWNNVIMDWTNGRFVFKGDFNIFVRTASKYDDCQLLHLPNLKLVVSLEWMSLGDPRDHHNVIQCAPDKIPEYSSNTRHDSFRAFRSQNVNLSITLETKSGKGGQGEFPGSMSSVNTDYPKMQTVEKFPMLSLYGSTLRWFENLKLILQGVTRPTRRGRIFNNLRPRKLQLSRHYKKVHLLLGLHKFQVCYWMSFAMQRGLQLLGGHLASTSEHILSLLPVDDGLVHRPKAEWSIVYVTSELSDSEIWLKSALLPDDSLDDVEGYLKQPVEKCYCLSVAKVSYGREPHREYGRTGREDTPTHRLVVYDLKGAWTQSNRNVVFSLFDTFMKNKQMKKNLSTEVLKAVRKDPTTTPLKRRTGGSASQEGVGGDDSTGASTGGVIAGAAGNSAGISQKLESGQAATMLQQLIAEAENKSVVFSDDLSSATRQQHLQGPQACQDDDILHKNWNIALVNAQVLLKGCETKGYVILSAAKAEIMQRIHRPVWKECTLVSKTTWVGNLECMQYYATVNAGGENDDLNENIMWLTVDNIQEKECTVISEIPQVPNMVGCGVSVGAVVSDTVGASTPNSDSPVQLQRIVSRCKCEFFYVGYGDISVDPATLHGELPPPPQEEFEPFFRPGQSAVNAFTLMHHDLDCSTNSLQYTMLLDIINNLLLFVDTHRKEALERLQRMRFQLQLQSVEDQRKPILILQTKVRSTLSRLRRLEKETYLVHKALADETSPELEEDLLELEQQVHECKSLLNIQAEELDIMLSCYKESQLLATSRLSTTRNDKPLKIVRANEIFFKHAQWRLTEADGQIGIADLVLTNFLYTKNSKSDDSVEHLLELGYVRMTNLLPNQIYKEVLLPTEIQSNMPVEHKRVVRIFCREKPPVGGISVKEHFEINVVPLTIGLTKKFYDTMLKFCFPERDPDNIDGEQRAGTSTNDDIDDNVSIKGTKKKIKRNRDSNFYVHIDDVEKMKERAEKNKLFIYIKIPEVPVRLSYKGNKEKNLEDIRDFSLVIPTLEYHNVTWTWLDLLLAIRSDSRKVILSQAIKQKLQFKRNIVGGSSLDEGSSPHEEQDKAKMLFGTTRHMDKPKKTGVFKFGK
ncbi:LOW QUALITY PROTEIN: protein hobbit [Atheta coriaria]|uniref:LOW QUALITY PROTEIN: protein hobbit n=1 Tax=Dalotia coriaria TaxID=877792 RepID=UPI0031F3A685